MKRKAKTVDNFIVIDAETGEIYNEFDNEDAAIDYAMAYNFDHYEFDHRTLYIWVKE